MQVIKLGAVEVLAENQIKFEGKIWNWNPTAAYPGAIEHGGNFLHGTEYRRPATSGFGAWETTGQRMGATVGPHKSENLIPWPHQITTATRTLGAGRDLMWLDGNPHDPLHVLCSGCNWRFTEGNENIHHTLGIEEKIADRKKLAELKWKAERELASVPTGTAKENWPPYVAAALAYWTAKGDAEEIKKWQNASHAIYNP